MDTRPNLDRQEGRSRCESVQSSLPDYLEGRLSAALRGPLRAHLQRCPLCSREHARERKLRALLAELRPQPAPRGFTDAVLSEVFAQVPLRERVAPAPARGALRRQWAPLPIGLLLLALVLGQWWPTARPEQLRESAAGVLVEGGRELTGVLTLLENARETGDLLTRPALDKAASLIRVERTLRGVLPPQLPALILLVAFGPIVLVFAVYRTRLKGVLSHALMHPTLR